MNEELNTGRVKACWREKYPDEEVFVENSNYPRGSIKRRILKDDILDYRCSICGQGPHWNNKPMTLILDHINGINNDHRIENLRFVCSNCNIQLPTFCGKNKSETIKSKSRNRHYHKKSKPKIRKENRVRWSKEEMTQILSEYDTYTEMSNSLCVDKSTIKRAMKIYGLSFTPIIRRKTKVDWDSIDLKNLKLELKTWTAIGKKLGVSDNAVRKRAKKLGINC